MRGDRVRTPQVQQVQQVQLWQQSGQTRRHRERQEPQGVQGLQGLQGSEGAQEPQRPWQRAAPVPLPGAAYPDWEAIYTDNVGRIHRLMFSKVGNRPDAEDLTSQVFLTAYGPLRTTAGVAQVRAYLTATARTVLAEHWRRTLGHQVTEIDLETTDLANYAGLSAGAVGGLGSSSGSGASAGIDPAGSRDAAGGRDAGKGRTAGGDGFGADEGGDGGGFAADGYSVADARAARILEALPQRQRQILVLRFLRGYTIRQAAAELDVTIANAKVLQHRALKAAAKMEDSRVEGVKRGRGVERGERRQAEDEEEETR